MVAAGPRVPRPSSPGSPRPSRPSVPPPCALALGPVYALQLAISYINLAIPSAAGRIAVNVRFFQRHGVPAGGAIAAGAMDGACGFIVQAVLLLGLLLVVVGVVDLDLGSAVDSAGQLLPIVVIIAGIAIGAVAVAYRWRRWGHAVGAAARVRRARRDPQLSVHRAALLFGGNLGTEIFALALGTFSRGSAIPSGSGSCCSSTSASGSCRA